MAQHSSIGNKFLGPEEARCLDNRCWCFAFVLKTHDLILFASVWSQLPPLPLKSWQLLLERGHDVNAADLALQPMAFSTKWWATNLYTLLPLLIFSG